MYLGGYPKASKIVHNRDFRNVAEAAQKPAWICHPMRVLHFLSGLAMDGEMKGYDE
jgi:hypothetical protein